MIGHIKRFLFWSPLMGMPVVPAWGLSALLLGARLWLANLFFFVGLSRLNEWDNQAFLFSEIHPFPGVPGEVAAVGATAGEILLPVLLALGLLTRVGALGLLAMTATIQFIVARTPQGMENMIANPEHYTWMAVALLIAILGGGRVSLDARLR